MPTCLPTRTHAQETGDAVRADRQIRFRLLEAWHLASLDAPTVALVWLFAFAWVAHVRAPGWTPVLLALVTWILYVGDRLLDARSAMRGRAYATLRERHYFHWRHRRILIPVAATLAVIAIALVHACMPRLFVERNSVLAGATLAYFTGVHSLRSESGFAARWIRVKALFTKELLVGLLFTTGCLLPVLSRAAREHLPWLIGVGLYFAAIAWLNCFAIQQWESGEPNHRSRSVVRFAVAAAIIGATLAIAASPFTPRASALFAIGAICALLIGLLDRMRTRIAPVTLRACVDLVLLLPVLLLAA